LRRFNRARARRGPENPTQPEGKPLWMRWPTWRRLTAQFLATVEGRLEFDEKMTERLRKLTRLDCLTRRQRNRSRFLLIPASFYSWEEYCHD
jgi:hypothetical protein